MLVFGCARKYTQLQQNLLRNWCQKRDITIKELFTNFQFCNFMSQFFTQPHQITPLAPELLHTGNKHGGIYTHAQNKQPGNGLII